MTENGCADNGQLGENCIIIETTDEDGQVHLFEKLKEIEVDGQEYALLIYRGESESCLGETWEESGKEESDDEDAADADEDEGEVVVMRISHEDDNQEVYEAIEDEEEFERVVAYIENLDEEEFAIDLSDFISQIPDENSEKESKN